MNDLELLARLKAADPALTSDAPLPDVNRLVEATMTIDTGTRPEKSTNGTGTRPETSSVETATRPAKSTLGGGRRRLLPMAAAAALLVVGGGVTWGVMAADERPDSARSSSTAPLALTAEGADGATQALCVEATVDLLRGYPVAFEGTVTSEEGLRVDLRVDHWFRGGDATTVRLTHHELHPEAIALKVGQRYLVTAEDGVVPICGGTIEATEETRSLYRRAFEN
ncbi:hypothetical protein ACFS5L_34620 [Streptomyces phyllanthi]|uniref:Uncharacterized protein n=1 Tax=Streptomyces phyllanthi TaxID=1803180 RepID=A0A5N8WBJ9_9ACTN|nr:hypothetical protein [Streptomyces phyllanthi]MPY44847.1 hypothetical protein [Streptomyces phyllanthi]